MLDLEVWQEIGNVIRKNKLRTLLTALGVFWGIFMLVIMMGFGNGLQYGVSMTMGPSTVNACYIWAQRSSMPFKGLPAGRSAKLNNGDGDAIEAAVSGIEHFSPRCQLGGWRDNNNVVRKNRTGSFSVYGDFPVYANIEKLEFPAGRFINQLDIDHRRKVAVIGQRVRDILFDADEDPIGDFITVRGAYFMVVGVFKSMSPGERAAREEQSVYIPFTTFQQAFNFGDRLGWFVLTAQPGVKVSKLESEAKAVLAERHSMHPNDELAFGSFNSEERFGKIMSLFDGIRGFVWIVGVLTLLAGAFGVSNIMLIAVKERMKELGIRKAMGATPGSIISLILMESMVLTACAGIFGLALGVGLLELVTTFAPQNDGAFQIFDSLTISADAAMAALGLLMFAGLLAGVIPARHAAMVKPIEALRS